MQIIKRAEWGARPSRALRPVAWGNAAVIHHTADKFEGNAIPRPGKKWWNLAKYARDLKRRRKIAAAIAAYEKKSADLIKREKAAMRAMQNFHMDGRGWSDIGYHYVIFPSGHVYEGRPARTWGAHCLNGNHMPGISFMGNYEVQVPTPHAIKAYKDLLAHLGIKAPIGHYKVRGNATACPGKNLKSALGL